MHNDDSPMHEYFAKLGLGAEIADLYLALQANGPQSLLQLARNANVERTRVYRLLDTLVEYHLIEIEEHYKRKIYKAAPLSNLQLVLAKRDQDVRDLQQELFKFQAMFETPSEHSPLAHVQFYRGAEGIKQVLWNQTKASGELLSILFQNIQTKTNLAFFERWVERCNQRGLTSRSIVGDHFLASQRLWYAEHTNEMLKRWHGRYVPEQMFAIRHSMFMHDNILAYVEWREDDVFAIEIYNQQIADTQRQFFDMLWRQALPVPGHGENDVPSK